MTLNGLFIHLLANLALATILTTVSLPLVENGQTQLCTQYFRRLSPCQECSPSIPTTRSTVDCARACRTRDGCFAFNEAKEKDAVTFCDLWYPAQTSTELFFDGLKAQEVFIAQDNFFHQPGSGDSNVALLVFESGLRDGMILTISGVSYHFTHLSFTDIPDVTDAVHKTLDLVIDIRFNTTHVPYTLIMNNYRNGGWLDNQVSYDVRDYITEGHPYHMVITVRQTHYEIYILGRGRLHFSRKTEIELSSIRYVASSMIDITITSCCEPT